MRRSGFAEGFKLPDAVSPVSNAAGFIYKPTIITLQFIPFLKIFKCLFIFEKEREHTSKGGQREREI